MKMRDTPLGTVYFECNHDESLEIEFLTFDFKPIIPPSMSLDGCFCGIYRIKAIKDSLPCSFKCIFKDGEMSPETGESLVAVTCEDASTILSIGTEEVSLQSRSHYDKWLPKRIESAIHPDNVEILNNGVQVHLPALMKDERSQFILLLRT